MLILVRRSYASLIESYSSHCTGGNPSAEEMEKALESGASQVNNVVHSMRLQSTQFDKKVSSHHSWVCSSEGKS